MTGFVDDFGRALVPIQLRNSNTGIFVKLDAWIDTGFTGELLLPKSIVASLGLNFANVVKAELGDGSETIFETYDCQLKWFSKQRTLEALETTGDCLLLGVSLLQGRKLLIDYKNKRVSIR